MWLCMSLYVILIFGDGFVTFIRVTGKNTANCIFQFTLHFRGGRTNPHSISASFEGCNKGTPTCAINVNNRISISREMLHQPGKGIFRQWLVWGIAHSDKIFCVCRDGQMSGGDLSSHWPVAYDKGLQCLSQVRAWNKLLLFIQFIAVMLKFNTNEQSFPN